MRAAAMESGLFPAAHAQLRKCMPWNSRSDTSFVSGLQSKENLKARLEVVSSLLCPLAAARLAYSL